MSDLIDVVLVEDEDDPHADEPDLLQVVTEAVEWLHLLRNGDHHVHDSRGTAPRHNAHLADKRGTNSYEKTWKAEMFEINESYLVLSKITVYSESSVATRLTSGTPNGCCM